MSKKEKRERREWNELVFPILECIADNPETSRTKLREITKGDKTIKRILLFWEKIGAIELKKDSLGKLDAWESTITDFGYQILVNAGYKMKKSYLKSKKYAPLEINDMKKLRDFFHSSNELDHISTSQWNELAKLTDLWIGAFKKEQRTILLTTSTRLAKYMDDLKRQTFFKNSTEFNEYRMRLLSNIEKLEMDLVM